MAQESHEVAMEALTARLRVTAVAPGAVQRALSDPLRLVHWFEQHQPLLGLEPGSPGAYFRGAYHFSNFFTPHAPPDSQYVLEAMHWPDGADTPRVVQRYGWMLFGHPSTIMLELAPAGTDGTLLAVTHSGLPEELPGIGSSRAYWTVVLENLRLYLLGRDGLSCQQTLGPGGLDLSTGLITPAGLDATAAAWELLTDAAQVGLLLPPGLEPGGTL